MKNLRGRAILRGKPLDENCKRASVTTREYGQDDNRKFCYGLMEMMSGDLLGKCRECKAFVGNSEPPQQ